MALPACGPEIGNDLGWILAFAVAGTLFEIPTAGEVPTIQAMLSLGVGAGPAGVLLIAATDKRALARNRRTRV